MMKKNFSLVLLLAFTCFKDANASRNVQDYLNNRQYPKKIMAIRGGTVYGHYNASVYKVDIDSEHKPDFVADIRNVKAFEDFPNCSFDQILLCNLPTVVFDDGARSTFENLNRILKPAGTLEFNDMRVAKNVKTSQAKKDFLDLVFDGKANPFCQPLAYEDLGQLVVNGSVQNSKIKEKSHDLELIKAHCDDWNFSVKRDFNNGWSFSIDIFLDHLDLNHSQIQEIREIVDTSYKSQLDTFFKNVGFSTLEDKVKKVFGRRTKFVWNVIK